MSVQAVTITCLFTWNKSVAAEVWISNGRHRPK